jgi:hypothetical protein
LSKWNAIILPHQRWIAGLCVPRLGAGLDDRGKFLQVATILIERRFVRVAGNGDNGLGAGRIGSIGAALRRGEERSQSNACEEVANHHGRESSAAGAMELSPLGGFEGAVIPASSIILSMSYPSCRMR